MNLRCMVESSDDEDTDVPKPSKRPRPVAKDSQREAKVPNVADLTTKKGSSTQRSIHIRKFLFFFGGCT
jgi:hypothetical protein